MQQITIFQFYQEFIIVARLDGRNFTHLTKEKHQFKAPYDQSTSMSENK